MAQTILYYPNIDIQDGQWLRNAILYWDNVASIVPYDNYRDFSLELQYLIEQNLYTPIYPQNLFDSEYVTDFTNTFVKRINQYSMNFNNKANSNKNYVATHLDRIHKNKIYAPALQELIHCNKLPNNLLDCLKDGKYINDQIGGEWLEIDSKVAAIYMRTLAEYTIKCYSDDIVLGTDKTKSQHEIYSHCLSKSTSTCLTIDLNNCLPQPAMNLSFEKLLDFKNVHNQEFQELRKQIREFESSLCKCSSCEEVKFETEKFKESWQYTMAQTQKMFTLDKIDFVLGNLSSLVSAPALASAVEKYVLKCIPPLASSCILGSVAAISVCHKSVSYCNKVNKHRSSSGFAYLIRASKEGIVSQL